MTSEKTVAEKKELDEEKLNNVRQLMNEAKSTAKTQASSNKQEVNKKLGAVLEALELPSEWFQQDTMDPAVLIKELDGVIERRSKVVHSATVSHKCNTVELSTEASGGRALCGIYYSEYEPPKPAGRPILLAPERVKMFEPSNRVRQRFVIFNKTGAATKFVSTIASTSSNFSVAAKGFGPTFIGEIEGAVGFHSEHTSQNTAKSSSTSVSVLKYHAITKKEFQIEEDQMKLTESARKYAMDLGEGEDGEEEARSFMKLYGSHYPTGVHKMGGIFYSIADAETRTSIETCRFTEAAVARLENKISAGYLGGGFVVGGSGTAVQSTASGEAEASQTKADSVSYRFSLEVIGPETSNPNTFAQLLDYNSTWAVIDRGPTEGYISVWRLLRSEGSEYKTASKILEKVWKEDERKRKEKWEETDGKEKDEKKEREKLDEVKKDLLKTKKEFLDRSYRTGTSYRPANATLKFDKNGLKHEDAYDQAIAFIMKNPEYHICKIVYWWTWYIFGGSYSLMCWEAPKDTPVTFDKISGGHVLVFSEVCFKWKDNVPLRG